MNDTVGAWAAPVETTIPMEVIEAKGVKTEDNRGLFVIHAALLHTGKVLWFSGHVEWAHYAPVSFVWDPTDASLTRVPFPGKSDLFCCHFVQLADGRLLTVGGSDPNYADHGSRGAKNIFLFDPTPTRGHPVGRWVRSGQSLRQGRWYPTAVHLGDDRVLVFSGRLEYGRDNPGNANIANEAEVLSPPRFKPKLVTGGSGVLPLYPGLHLGFDGRVYYTHTTWGQEVDEPSTRALTMTGPAKGAWEPFEGLPDEPPMRREEGMSVLLPPAQDGKILVVGGSEAVSRDTGERMVLQESKSDSVERIPGDSTRASVLSIAAGGPPTWSKAKTTHTIQGYCLKPRINGHLVLLPDATVLLLGGHDRYKWTPSRGHPAPTTPTLPAEIFTPEWTAATWPPAPGDSLHVAGFREVAPHTHPRMYHSAALLLPDGRVVVAGGADPDDGEPTIPWESGWPANLRWAAPRTPGSRPLNRKSYEIYSPPYLFRDQPAIDAVNHSNLEPVQVPYGTTFVISSLQAANIKVVALMRPGCVTHHTDTEQRFVTLPFTRDGMDLTVTMLPETEASIAPPGYYMLWIVDKQQRPCVRAWFIHVTSPKPRARRSSSSGG
jgi:galactose oxidase-like protein